MVMTNTSPGLTAALSLKNGEGNTDRSFSFSKEKVGLRLFLMVALLLVACTSSKTASNDDDGCIGRCGMVGGVACGDCEYGYTCNTAQFCVEVTNDDIPIEEQPDLDIYACPSMKSYANVKAAGFPLKDANDKITFCRPGCDTPTENDPQCARNLWEWINWSKYQEYQNGQSTIDECYPWPCQHKNMKAMPVSYSECDKDLGSGGYSASMSALYDLKILGNEIGIVLSNIKYRSTMVYDIEKDSYVTVGYGGHASGFASGRIYFYTTSGDYEESSDSYTYTYILSAKKTATSYRYEVIYDDEQHQAYFSRPPLVGDKWVVLNVKHRATDATEVLYSKVDEWKWHPLKYSKVYEGNIVDNRLTFIVGQHEIYVCDLDKLPFDPVKECLRIDREGEMAYQPRLNEENKDQLVYFAGVGEYGLTLVDISSGVPTYTLLPIQPTEPNTMGLEPEELKGNLISYMEYFMPPNEETRTDVKSCFYRIDTKKQYCPTKPSFLDGRYDMGFNSFDGNYQLWKAPASVNARFRDMKCYCEKEGVCPFEGMK